VSRPLEVADIFRGHGAAWRKANAGHVSLGQLKVMSAIENCRTAALGGHAARCEKCRHSHIAYNSCRDRHCPKCQGAAARQWLAEREADLLPVAYYHLVFTLPAPISDIAYQNKAVIYNILFKASAETLITIAADPKHLGARIGVTSVLHTWGSALTHHPHVHMIVPGGGISLDGTRWVRADRTSSCRCACSHACSADCYWTSSSPRTKLASLDATKQNETNAALATAVLPLPWPSIARSICFEFTLDCRPCEARAMRRRIQIRTGSRRFRSRHLSRARRVLPDALTLAQSSPKDQGAVIFHNTKDWGPVKNCAVRRFPSIILGRLFCAGK
jgi:hypothetical protein